MDVEGKLSEEIKSRVETSRDLQHLGQTMLEQTAVSTQDALSRALDTHAVRAQDRLETMRKFVDGFLSTKRCHSTCVFLVAGFR